MNGEVDVVKTSPRSNLSKNLAAANAGKGGKNEIRLTQDQLVALINSIKSGEDFNGKNSKSNSLENLNLNLSDGEADRYPAPSKPLQPPPPPQPQTQQHTVSNQQEGAANSNAERIKRMLIEKKKQKWASEKGNEKT